MNSVRLDYGDTHMDIDVPDSAVIVQDGKAFEEPTPLTDPLGATREAIRNPVGCPPLGDQIGPGAQVVIAFPDRVKGGAHATAHRRLAIATLADELNSIGVDDANITLICGMGLHRKNRREELSWYLGEEILQRFPKSRVVNHDAEDPDGMVQFGHTGSGEPVEFNRLAAEADMAIMLGHVQGNPYGGYSGGYKMPCTGLTGWRSISSHHTPATMHRDDFVPIQTGSHFRHQLTRIGKAIETHLQRPFFTVDAVLNGSGHQLAVVAGSTAEVERRTWPIADRRTKIDISGEPADVLVIGMPRDFHYGPGMGSNPILIMQAIGSSVARAADALRNGAVVICASICDGWFNDEWFPAYREVFELYQHCITVDEMGRYEEEVSTKPRYLHQYRNDYAYHPFHAFSMLYMGAVALKHSAAVLVVGAKEPGFARAMGCRTVRTFEQAMLDARRYVGRSPRVLVVPSLAATGVHLTCGRS